VIFAVKKLLLMIAALMAAASIVSAQNWMPTGAPTNSWTCIASSANGSNLIAGVNGGPLYLSTNSGATWTITITTNESWGSVASSADGTHLFAASSFDPGGLYISTNSGGTWQPVNLPDLYWGSVASSADGRTLVAVAPIGAGGAGTGGVFSTTNGGISWATNNVTNRINIAVSVAMSANGTKMFITGSEQSFRSTNSGTTWAIDTNAPLCYSFLSPSQYIASSADGTKLVLCLLEDVYNNPSPIYISTNSGDTWSKTSAPSNEWAFVTSSADGNTIVAVPAGADRPATICLSTNGGTTWTTNSPIERWGAAASSADGGKLVIAAAADANYEFNSGPIYNSQSVQSPQANIIRANSNVIVSWIVPSTNFVLQQSPDLSSWKSVTNNPVLNLNNLQNEVTLPSTNSKSFYRLKTP
jgi:hypothetical protein